MLDYTTLTLSRFWPRVNKTDTCWLWVGAISSLGYAKMSYKGKPILAHRWSYTYFKGEIPENLEIDHLCRVRNCVNPDHLEAVTRRENNLRKIPVRNYKKRDHCKRGHLYSDNAYTDINGKRHCYLCEKLWLTEHPRVRVP